MRADGDEGALLLGEIVRQCIREGFPVSIDGLGTFRRTPSGSVEFAATARARVFVAYVEEDSSTAARIYDRLVNAGFDPWLDKRKLLPGQDWPACIERAIGVSDFFLPCFSSRALRKRGQFQRELRTALECARQFPLDDSFIVPVRLEPCELPRRIRTQYQYVDLFPDWQAGMDCVIRSLEQQVRVRSGR